MVGGEQVSDDGGCGSNSDANDELTSRFDYGSSSVTCRSGSNVWPGIWFYRFPA